MERGITDELSIIRATDRHLTVLSEMYSELASWRLEKYAINDWPIPFPESEVKRLVSVSDTFIAYLGDRAIGTVALEDEDYKIWGHQDLSATYVHRLGARIHNLGVGAALLKWADIYSLGHRKDRLRLDCNFADKKLCSHYESLGFALVDTKQIIPTYKAARYERKIS